MDKTTEGATDASNSSAFEFFQFRNFPGIPVLLQIALIAALYVAMTIGYFFSFKATGKMGDFPGPSVSLLFVPIYEEAIFRGIVLRFFEKKYGFWSAIVLTSVLFSIWHLKNIFWLEPFQLIHQMVYTGVIFGPVTAFITLKLRSIWPSVAIHYLNNMPYKFLF
jgi:membrane protease YdiL (CAAX protease family)